MARSPRLDDPDETEGRRLYRAQADAIARTQMAIAKRKVWLKKDASTPVFESVEEGVKPGTIFPKPIAGS